MGLLDWLFGKKSPPPQAPAGTLGVDELSRRLGLTEHAIRSVAIVYHEFTIPKRTGGSRRISAPDPALKQLQRRINRRLLTRLHAHPSANGFERARSIVTNALPHARCAVVLRLDLKDFFPSITATRVENYFRVIGWNADAAKLLATICTHNGKLPQGAPTSPRLSNLVNYRLDARLDGLARAFLATYTRYADDMTISFPQEDGRPVNGFIYMAKRVLADEGYQLHTHKKLRIQRAHDRQLVTGLVVNQSVNLPRATRRWLRAVEHRIANGRIATLTPMQLQGWKSIQSMIARQSVAGK